MYLIEPIWWHVPLAITCLVGLSLVIGFLVICMYYLLTSSKIIIEKRQDETNTETVE